MRREPESCSNVTSRECEAPALGSPARFTCYKCGQSVCGACSRLILSRIGRRVRRQRRWCDNCREEEERFDKTLRERRAREAATKVVHEPCGGCAKGHEVEGEVRGDHEGECPVAYPGRKRKGPPASAEIPRFDGCQPVMASPEGGETWWKVELVWGASPGEPQIVGLRVRAGISGHAREWVRVFGLEPVRSPASLLQRAFEAASRALADGPGREG